jgi:hypothetical protein
MKNRTRGAMQPISLLHNPWRRAKRGEAAAKVCQTDQTCPWMTHSVPVLFLVPCRSSLAQLPLVPRRLGLLNCPTGLTAFFIPGSACLCFGHCWLRSEDGEHQDGEILDGDTSDSGFRFVSLLRLRSMDDDMVCSAITVGGIVAEARHNTKIALILRVSRETCFL